MSDLSACYLAIGDGVTVIKIDHLMAATGFLISALAFALWPIMSDYVDRNGPPGPGQRMR